MIEAHESLMTFRLKIFLFTEKMQSFYEAVEKSFSDIAKQHHSVNFQNMKKGNIRFVGNLIGDVYWNF